MTDRPTLMFCVGATKAGTSWLYRYLHDHDDCHLRSVKELHFFDTLERGGTGARLAALARDRDDLAARRLGATGPQAENLARRIGDVEALARMQAAGTAEAYLDYLEDGRGGQRLVGDLTPAYALLPVERLAAMADLPRDLRFVYLMRDPVERLWSHVRMIAQRRLKPGEDIARKAKRVLARILRGEGHADVTLRGDYRGAVERLRAAVPEARLMIAFSERLISVPGIRQLCDFLGIGYREPDPTQREHAGPVVMLADGQRAAAARLLAAQYDFVEKTLGPLPERWLANMARA